MILQFISHVKHKTNPERKRWEWTHGDVRTGGDDQQGMWFGVLEGSFTEVGSQTQTSLGRWHKSVDQVHHLAVMSHDILRVRHLVLSLELAIAFVPHDVRSLGSGTLFCFGFGCRCHFAEYPSCEPCVHEILVLRLWQGSLVSLV